MCCLKLLTQFKNLESCISGTSNENVFSNLWLHRGPSTVLGAPRQERARNLFCVFYQDCSLWMCFFKKMKSATRFGLKRHFMCPSYGKADKYVVEDAQTLFLSLQFSGHTPQQVNEYTLFLLKAWLERTSKIPYERTVSTEEYMSLNNFERNCRR